LIYPLDDLAAKSFISCLLQLIQAATASEAVSAAGLQRLRQLFCLTVSCLKLAKYIVQHQQGRMAETAAGLNVAQHALAAAAALAHRSSAGAWQQAGTAAAHQGMGSNAGTGSNSGSSSSSSRQAADCAAGAQGVVHEAMLLVGRGMHLAGTMLGDVLDK
jgi:hypothetical protein